MVYVAIVYSVVMSASMMLFGRALITRIENRNRSEAQLRLGDGREDLVKARIALHTFQETEVRKSIDAGTAVAKETLAAANAAIHEKDVRRMGLAVSVVLISITILAIWILIRRIESNTNGSPMKDVSSAI